MKLILSLISGFFIAVVAGVVFSTIISLADVPESDDTSAMLGALLLVSWIIATVWLYKKEKSGVSIHAAQAKKIDSEVALQTWIKKKDGLRDGYGSPSDWKDIFSDGEFLIGLFAAESKKAILDSTKKRLINNANYVADTLKTLESARLTATAVASESVGKHIQELSRLRSSGDITEEEFVAFSERFKMTSGERAKLMVDSIKNLNQQYKEGFMEHGNYHETLWTLMDRLDRDMKKK